MLALWLELSVSIILYCGEVVALLIHQQAAARTAKAAAQAPPPAHENVGGAGTRRLDFVRRDGSLARFSVEDVT